MHRWSLTVLLSLATLAAGVLAPGERLFKRVSKAPAPAPGAAVSDVDGPLDVTLSLDTNAVVESQTNERYLLVTITAAEGAQGVRHPVDLALVMDVSGSMSSDDKLDQARRAAHALVDALGPEDRLALVTFEDRGHLAMPLRGGDPARAHAVIDTMATGGSTNISEGLTLGMGLLSDRDTVRKVILVTDGQANAGITDPAALAALASQEGVTFAALGVGLGYNEVLLSRMADSGGGSYGYVHGGTDLAALFSRELATSSALVARDNHLTLTFARGVTPTDVLAWDGVVAGNTVQLPIGDLAAGQSRRVVVRVAIEGEEIDPAEVVRSTLNGTAVADGAVFSEVDTLATQLVAHDAEAEGWADRTAQGAKAQALAASAADEAAKDFRRGDTQSARSKLSAAFRQVTAVRETYSIPELNAETDQLRALGYMNEDVATKTASEYSRSSGRGE